MMAIISPINSRLTIPASIRRLIILPAAPPNIPQPTMITKSPMANSGTLPVASVLTRLAIWENMMIYREFCAAVFVSMEK